MSAPPLFGKLQLESVTHAWIWVVLLAVGAGVLFVTYRGIFQRSEQRLVWALMLLRAAGILALVFGLARPVWTRSSQWVDPGRVAVMVDNSVSMSLADPSGSSRYELARQVVEQLQSKLDEDPLQPRTVVDLFDVQGTPLTKTPDEPRVERTDLAHGLRSVVSQLRARPLVGVVMISDGVDNTGTEQFQELADTPVPVHTVGFRSDPDSSRLDLAIRAVQAPARVIVNNSIQVQLSVTKTSGPELTAKVAIKRGRDTLAFEEVPLPAGDAEQLVTITLEPKEVGTFVVTASITAGPGERSLSNNARQFPLEVDGESIKVFYIEGFLRYEYKFLKSRLEEDPDVALVSLVRRANPGAVDASSEGKLLTEERLKEFDVVILGDMESDFLAPVEYQNLLTWLDQPGTNKHPHSLLALGGYHSLGADGFRNTPLAAALPVEFVTDGPQQSEDPFVLELTDAGQRHPIFALADDRIKNLSLWSSAPHLLGSCLVTRAKAGADVLAVNPGFVIEGKPAVVVAAQRYGAGHTMVITADTTWRWSFLNKAVGQSDTLFARFWSQTIRWLAGRESASQQAPLTLSTDRPDYEVGKPVLVRAARQSTPELELSNAPVAVEIVGEDGKSLGVPVKARSTEPDVFSGTFVPAASGRYQVLATLSRDGKPIANQSTEFLVHGSGVELADPRTNRELLQSIARMTGGVYFDVEDASNLASKLDRRERRLERVTRTEFWSRPWIRTWLFGFFLIAVTGEWILRRWNHLL